MITITPVTNGFKFVQSIPFFTPNSSTASWLSASHRMYARHLADWILTDLTDNGGGDYTATGGTLAELYGEPSYTNGVDTISGTGGACVDLDIPIYSQIVHCFVPLPFTLNVVTDVAFTSGYTITVTKKTVTFIPCSHVNSNTRVFTPINLEPDPDTSLINNLVLAPRCGRFANANFKIEPFLIGPTSSGYLFNEAFYDPDTGNYRYPTQHAYTFPAFVSQDKCVIFPNGAAEIEGWLSRYYQSAIQGLDLWDGNIPKYNAAQALVWS